MDDAPSRTASAKGDPHAPGNPFAIRLAALGLEMRPALWMFVVGACSAPPSPPLVANHQRALPLVCTDQVIERLTSTLRARWDARALSLRCQPGQFHVAGFFLEAHVDGQRRTGIVDPSGTELVPFRTEPAAEPFTFVDSYRTADLDGDGEDEIVESWRRSHRATHELAPDRWLVVRVVSNRRLLRIQGPYVARSHPELGACTGTWQLRPGGIDLAIRVMPGIPPTDCLPAGRHRFSLRGGMLVDATRALRRR